MLALLTQTLRHVAARPRPPPTPRHLRLTPSACLTPLLHPIVFGLSSVTSGTTPASPSASPTHTPPLTSAQLRHPRRLGGGLAGEPQLQVLVQVAPGSQRTHRTQAHQLQEEQETGVVVVML